MSPTIWVDTSAQGDTHGGATPVTLSNQLFIEIKNIWIYK